MTPFGLEIEKVDTSKGKFLLHLPTGLAVPWTKDGQDAIDKLKEKTEKYLAQEFPKLKELREYEWSGSGPISRRQGCGQCLYCGALEIHGHDPLCAYNQENPDIDKIKKEVEETRKQNKAQEESIFSDSDRDDSEDSSKAYIADVQFVGISRNDVDLRFLHRIVGAIMEAYGHRVVGIDEVANLDCGKRGHRQLSIYSDPSLGEALEEKRHITAKVQLDLSFGLNKQLK